MCITDYTIFINELPRPTKYMYVADYNFIQITTLFFAQHVQACKGHLQGDKLKNTDSKYQSSRKK